MPGEKARYEIQRDLVIKKINTLLLPLMRKHDIDMWITLDREYNPDPFAAELGGQGGVRNAHIFFDTGDRLEKILIFSHPPRQDLAPRLYDQLIHYAYRPEGLDHARAVGLDIASFLPGLRIMRNGLIVEANDPNTPIEPGDCLSVDAGLSFIHFQTDMKRSAYVLRPGETEPPPGMKKAMGAANAVTDRLIANMVPGRLGHEVWDVTMAALNEEGYEIAYAMGAPVGPRMPEVGIYCHSVGTSVHDIGARTSEDNPHAFGDRVRYPLAVDNWYSVEHHTGTPIAEWDYRTLRVNTEEDAMLTERGIEFFVPRQTEWLLIPSGE